MAADGPRSSFPSPVDCILHGEGHTPHHIQARLANEDAEHPPIPAEIVDLDGVYIRVRIDGKVRRYRNHDVPRLAQMVARYGPKVFVQERWRLLHVPHYPDGGNYQFSIDLGRGPWHECKPNSSRPYDGYSRRKEQQPWH